MKSTQNLTASHGAEELSDEQLETVAGGWGKVGLWISYY